MIFARAIFYAWEAAYLNSHHLIQYRQCEYSDNCFSFTAQSSPYYMNQTQDPTVSGCAKTCHFPGSAV